jgi:uracil phosphoribosyltransferase
VQVANPPLVVPVMRAGLDAPPALDVIERPPGRRARRRETFLPPPTSTLRPSNSTASGCSLDPMLATGVAGAVLLRDAGAGPLVVVCVLAAPDGVETFGAAGFDAELFTASIDERLNEMAYIVPGLGDAGDRQFGLA